MSSRLILVSIRRDVMTVTYDMVFFYYHTHINDGVNIDLGTPQTIYHHEIEM